MFFPFHRAVGKMQFNAFWGIESKGVKFATPQLSTQDSDLPGPAWPKSPGFGLAWGGSGPLKSWAQPKLPQMVWPWPGPSHGFWQKKIHIKKKRVRTFWDLNNKKHTWSGVVISILIFWVPWLDRTSCVNVTFGQWRWRCRTCSYNRRILARVSDVFLCPLRVKSLNSLALERKFMLCYVVRIHELWGWGSVAWWPWLDGSTRLWSALIQQKWQLKKDILMMLEFCNKSLQLDLNDIQWKTSGKLQGT